MCFPTLPVAQRSEATSGLRSEINTDLFVLTTPKRSLPEFGPWKGLAFLDLPAHAGQRLPLDANDGYIGGRSSRFVHDAG